MNLNHSISIRIVLLREQVQIHRDVPNAKALVAFDRKNTLRLISFALLTLLNGLLGPRAATTRNPSDCSTTLAREDSDQSNYRLVISFERFRMTGAACEGCLRGGIEPTPEGTDLLSPSCP